MTETGDLVSLKAVDGPDATRLFEKDEVRSNRWRDNGSRDSLAWLATVSRGIPDDSRVIGDEPYVSVPLLGGSHSQFEVRFEVRNSSLIRAFMHV
jgi:hypothetical protein